MNLTESIKTIQRATGSDADGVFGPDSARAVLACLARQELVSPAEVTARTLDNRTEINIATLDDKAQERFETFAKLAKATAATYGCEYVMISGFRTWEEQAALYQAHMNGGPHAVPAGYSMHNYKIAGDFGVFQGGKIYLDGGSASQAALADRVHAACAVHARACGLLCGASWSGGSKDIPHYQIDIGHATPTAADRELFNKKSGIL